MQWEVILLQFALSAEQLTKQMLSIVSTGIGVKTVAKYILSQMSIAGIVRTVQDASEYQKEYCYMYLPEAPIKPGDPGCDKCDFKMQCLSMKVAPCTVQHLDLLDLYKIYPHETVLRLVHSMFTQDDSQT